MPRVARPALVQIAAPAATVRDAARTHLGTDAAFEVPPAPDTQPAIAVRLEFAERGDTTIVTAQPTGEIDVPFFSWFFRPASALARRRTARYILDALKAAVDGGEPPSPPGPIVLLPPVAFNEEQAVLLATASAAVAVVSFAGALFGQLSSPIRDSFHLSDASLTIALALTRIGALIALIPTALADRRGRRTSIMLGVLGSAFACAISAIAPGIAFFTVAQALQRGLLITTATVAAIAVVEESPEGARAYSTSMLALAGGLGFSLAVVVLPFADLGANGWRIPFALGAATIFLARPIANRLRETVRYEAVAKRKDVARGRVREIVDKRYGRRFIVLAAAAFLTNIFAAPSSQLMNKYLEDVRNFSSTGIAVFRGVTTAVPGLIGLVLGGRLAEQRGRKPVAVIGLAIATLTQMIFFTFGGPIIWVMAATSILAAGAGGIALGTLDAELFATEVRSTSNALITTISVFGSGAGFLAAGLLAQPLGNLGRSIALTGLPALAAALILVPLLPESAARNLDDVSPTEEYGPDP